jgi:hypothetical protein
MGDITRATNLVGREPASEDTGDLLSVVVRLFLSGLRALDDDEPLAYIQSHKGSKRKSVQSDSGRKELR